MTGAQRLVFVGTDGGATTSKTGAVWADGTTVSTRLLQRPTGSADGPQVVVDGWVAGIGEYLADNGLDWERVGGVGLAIPGPYQRYGVFDKSPNLPESFTGFDVHTAYAGRWPERAGRAVPLIVGNDGNMGGVAEAQRARGARTATVLMLAPGSGLGCAFIDRDGLPLDGDTLAGMEAATCRRRCTCSAPSHTPAAAAGPGAASRSTPPSPACPTCWPNGSAEARHELRRRAAQAARVSRCAAWPRRAIRSPVEIFDFQARALGLHVATLAMALDPQFVVIGGGLMDPEATTERLPRALPADRPRDGAALSLARPARAHQRRPRCSGRPLPVDWRRPCGALPESLLTAGFMSPSSLSPV